MNASNCEWAVIPAPGSGALGANLLLEDVDIMTEVFEDDAVHQVHVRAADL